MKYLIINHGSNQSGSVERMEQFLIDNGEAVSKVIHPLEGTKRNYSSFSNDGITRLMPRSQLGLLSLFSDFFRSVRIINGHTFDVYVGANNFDTIPAIFCKYILRKRIRRIIYYPRDFFEERYKNSLLNHVYYSVENIAVRYSDITISNTQRAADKRKAFGLKDNKSKIVPNGVKLDNPTFMQKKIDKQKFIYVGDVSVEHGLHDILQGIKGIVKQLTIIGNGSDLDRVLMKCNKLGINVTLHKDKSHQFVIEQLKEFNGYGLAYYNTKFKWTIYCSPLKVAEYISTGVPVVMSDVPEIATLVKDKELGIVLKNLSPQIIKKQIDKFNTKDYSLKSAWYYKNYNAQKLYSDIFYET